MNNKSKDKGITIIALVVTIVALLILAAVAISLIKGQDGLFAKADNSAKRYTEESQNEEDRIQEILANTNGDETVTLTRSELAEIRNAISTLQNNYNALLSTVSTLQGTPNVGTINYTTSENEIGTWIDGKKLYRITFVYNTATSGSTSIEVGTLSNISEIETAFIDYSASYYINNTSNMCSVGAPISINSAGRNVDVATYSSYGYINMSNGKVIVLYGSTTASTKTVVTVCYTKK